MGVKVREKPPGSGHWYVFINHNGRRKAKHVGSEKAAIEVAKKIEAKLTLSDFGFVVDRQVRTFADYKRYWLKTYAEPHCKYSTYKGYESVFDTHLAVFDSKPLHEISRQEISELISRKLVEEKKSRGTVRNILAPLREMFNHAVDEGVLKVNPASRLGRFVKHTSSKANRLKIDPLTREEIPILLEASRKYGYDTYALNLCAVRTGMRMGELFGLQWGDLDFNSRFVQVQRSFVRSRQETPKSHQLRRIDMSKQLSEALQELKRQRKILFFTVRAEAEQLRVAGESEEKIPKLLGLKHGCVPEFIRTILRLKGEMPEWVFINEAGRQLEHNNFRRRVFEPLLVKAGVRRIRFHDLRHTFASLLLQQGESPQYVKEQMGHHSIQVTVDIYGHLIPGANRKAVDRLDDRQTEPAKAPKARRRKVLAQPPATPAQPMPAFRIATSGK
jgi:integrase